MSTTIPPLVCDTPPPIDEFEDISGDEDISGGANGSHFEHFEDESPSPTPSYPHRHPHSSLFSTDSFPVVEDISSDLNEMNSEFNDIESMDVCSVDVVLVENSIPPSSDEVNKMINQNEIDSLESDRISQDRSSFASLDVMGISMDTNLNCDDDVSNQSVCNNSQNFQSKRMDDSDFDEQQRRTESSNFATDVTNTQTADDEEENLGMPIFDLDEYKSSDFSLNESIIHTVEQSACEIESNEVIATVQSNKVNCDEKTLNEKFDADFSQFAGFQKSSSVLSITTVTPDQIESVQNCEIGTTIVHAEHTPHEVSMENTDYEDDEFGDFSSFSPPTIAASSPSDITTTIDQISMNRSSSSGSGKEEIVEKSKTSSKLTRQKSSKLDNLNDSNDISDRSSCEIMTNKFQQTTIMTNSSMEHETNANDTHPSYFKNIDYNLNVRAILSTLFPTNIADIDPEDDLKNLVKCSPRNGQIQFMNELTIHLKNVENAKALKHQWAKSVAKTFLVKSLGIDSRNILYGEKWNSSAPKFAANLGMSPLEPMKLNTNTSSDSSDMKSGFRAAADVPAAQFDWNSSGLINPLDGSRKSTHEERNEIPLESPKQWNDECQKAKKRTANIALETAKIQPTICSPIVPDMESSQPNNSNEPNTVFDSTNGEIETEQTSDSYNVPGSSGTMKETHIFTPNKSQSDIELELSVDSNSIDKKSSSEDTERVVVIKENVVKKEYRDIEYDPERVIALDEFSDFQFVNTTTTIAKEHIASECVQSSSIGFRSNAVINDNSELNSAAINRISNCNGFEKTHALNMAYVTLPIKQTTQIHKVHELKNDNYNQIENLKRSDESIIFANNTNYHNVQSVCSSEDIQPITSQIHTDKEKITSNAPTMMHSNILKPQLVSAIKPAVETTIKQSPNIEWPGPGIDTDQLMRLEQRFCIQPQANGTAILANGMNGVNNSSEDDEWSEFVSVEQPQTPITNILSKNLLKQQADEDDWSEFVSSTVPMNTKRTISKNQAPNYDFESINDSANKPNTMYNVSMNQRTSYMNPSHSEAPSMISNLPDLRFVTPKSLVHMPNSSLMKK